MKKTSALAVNVIFTLHVFLIFLLIMSDEVKLPAWVQVIGRIHPALIHLPIGLMVLFAILQFGKNKWSSVVNDELLGMILLLGSLTATFSAVMGFFLSLQSDYAPDDLRFHQYSGVIFSLLCFASLLFYARLQTMKTAGVTATLALLVSVVVTGHSGSVLTHGKNYLLAPVLPESTPVASDPTAYHLVVEPILSKKCFSCHNETKAKGGLVMTSVEKFRTGGKQGVEWSASESRLTKFIHLPLQNDDHMPPDGKPQLTAVEMKIIDTWIAGGANFDVRLADLPETDSLKILSSHVPSETTSPARAYEFPAASPEVLEKLNTPFRSVTPLFENSPALRGNFFIKEAFKASSLEELKSVDQQLVDLSLFHMPVTDDQMPTLSTFANLEKLNLNFTQVKGPGLKSLAQLKKLKVLSLCGTAVDFRSVGDVIGMPSLKEVYLWDTPVTEKDIVELKKQNPDVQIFSGSKGDDASKLRLSPPAFTADKIFEKGEAIGLKDAMPGAVIRYIVDGPAPDSVSGTVYTDPFTLETTSKVKALACKDGWYCSGQFEGICFLKGIAPLKSELFSIAEARYRGEGFKSLSDGRKGFTDVLNEQSWLGFRDHPLDAGFTFADNAFLSSLTISYAKITGSNAFPPEEVEIWGGKDKQNLRLLKKEKIDQPVKESNGVIDIVTVPFPSGHYGYLKIIARPVAKLPAWRSKKPEKGRLFVDEIFFY